MPPVKGGVTFQDPPETTVLRLKAMTLLGEATAHLDGTTIVVSGGIPGELVEVEVLPARRDVTTARVTRVLEPSPHRVAPPCPYFGPCTGCQWQHIDYQHQLELKRQAVEREFESVPNLTQTPVRHTLPSPDLWGYRNHARFTVARRGRLGFVNRRIRRFVEIQECMIMHPRINQMLAQLQGRCDETTQVALRAAVNADDYLVQPALESPDVSLVTGQPNYTERLQGHPFRIASPSFFQVNVPQAERMVELVRERLRLSGEELLVDAYAGVGTFAVLLADYAKQVIAIEESASAVRDAELNAQDVPNVEIRQGRAEDVLATLRRPPDAVILDPPRVGCHPRLLEVLKRLQPRRVAYVSCDPAALARDLAILCDGTYRLDDVQPVDMFPHTHHVECVATLTLELASVEGGGPLLLASTSPRRYDILQALGLDFQVVPSELEEPPPGGHSPEEYVEMLALGKAQAVVRGRNVGVVIGADTVVVDGAQVLGKPRRPAEAEAMLRQLRGRRHRVVTGVAVINTATGHSATTVQSSQVTMRPYSDAELQRYVASGGAIGKAGAYAIQHPAFQPAGRVEGCYLNVVGLSACALLKLLAQVGITVTPRRGWRPPEQCGSCPLRYEEATP